MSKQTKYYRIEVKGVMSGVWMFFLQLPKLQQAKRVIKATRKANPEMKLRIREINLLDLSIFKLFEETD